MPQIFFIHSSEEIHRHLSFNIAFWPHSITKFPNSRRHVTIFLWPPLFNLVGEVCLIQKYIFLWFEDIWYVGLMVKASKGISANADCSGHKETERAWNLKFFLPKSQKVKSNNLLKKSTFWFSLWTNKSFSKQVSRNPDREVLRLKIAGIEWFFLFDLNNLHLYHFHLQYMVNPHSKQKRHKKDSED